MSNDFFVLLLQGLAGGAVVSGAMAALRAKVMPKVPRFTIPLIVVALSAGADYLSTLVTGSSMSPLMITLYTTLAVYLRESVTTVQQHGLNG